MVVEMNNPEVLTDNNISQLIKLGYSGNDLLYLASCGVTVDEFKCMTPKEVSQMSDFFAEMDAVAALHIN